MDLIRRCIESFRSRIMFQYRYRRRRTRRSLRLTSMYGILTSKNAPFIYAIEQLATFHLAPESTTTTDDKIEAIAYIGHLSWTGGKEAAEYTGNKYLHLFASLLRDTDTPHSLKLQIIKSLSEICCGIEANQDLAREHMLIPTIVDYMYDMEDDEETRKWSLHTLFYMLCSNRENQRQALQSSKLKVCTLLGLDDNWEEWEHNEAQELETMLLVAMRSQ